MKTSQKRGQKWKKSFLRATNSLNFLLGGQKGMTGAKKEDMSSGFL